MKEELLRLSQRIETLTRNQSVNKMQLRSIQN
jgi:chromosome segregation ATPase